MREAADETRQFWGCDALPGPVRDAFGGDAHSYLNATNGPLILIYIDSLGKFGGMQGPLTAVALRASRFF